MRVVVHAGMPKTGTSAVQRAWRGHAAPEFEYGDLGRANHSLPLLTIFEDPDTLARHQGLWPRGAAALDRLPEERRNLAARLDAQLGRLRGTDTTLLLSAETLWSARAAGAVGRLADHLRARADEVRVLAYIRPPLSYAASAFQQRLKGVGGSPGFDLARLWPGYRRAVGTLDAAFGAEAVILRPYDRARLAEGDVVADVGAVLGLPPPEVRPAANPALPAEAVAVLYALRREGLGLPQGYESALRDGQALIAGLRALGRSRLTIHPEAWAPVAAAYADDLAWIEARLGARLADPVDPDALAIRSEDDLLRLAAAQAEHPAVAAFRRACAAPASPVREARRRERRALRSAG